MKNQEVATNTINQTSASQLPANVSSDNSIVKDVKRSEIYIGNIGTSDYQKEGTKTVQLRQDITTTASYPTKRIDTDMQDNLFSTTDFGFEMKDFTTKEQRVAFMDVPINATQAEIEERLKSAKSACLYKVMSNHPILTDSQKYAISNDIRTMDDFANSQAVRYPDGTVDSFGTDISGKLVLDKNGKIQYRKVFFSLQNKADMDLRTADKEDMYISNELKVELGIPNSEQQVM